MKDIEKIVEDWDEEEFDEADTHVEAGQVKDVLQKKQIEKGIKRFKELIPEGSILPLLEFANRKGFAKIGLVPFAAGSYRDHRYNRIVRNGYQQFVEDFRNWGHEYPKQINLYHFDWDDYSELYVM